MRSKFINGMLDAIRKKNHKHQDIDRRTLQQRQSQPGRVIKRGDGRYPSRFDRTTRFPHFAAGYGERSHDELRAIGIETITSGRILGIRSSRAGQFRVWADGWPKSRNTSQDAVPTIDFQTSKILDFGDGSESRDGCSDEDQRVTVWASTCRFRQVSCAGSGEVTGSPSGTGTGSVTDLIVNPTSRGVETRSRDSGGPCAQFMTVRGIGVETPMMRDCRGALARPVVTHTTRRNEAVHADAPEHTLKRLTVGGASRKNSRSIGKLRPRGDIDAAPTRVTMMESTRRTHFRSDGMTERCSPTIARKVTGSDRSVGDRRLRLRHRSRACH